MLSDLLWPAAFLVACTGRPVMALLLWVVIGGISGMEPPAWPELGTLIFAVMVLARIAIVAACESYRKYTISS